MPQLLTIRTCALSVKVALLGTVACATAFSALTAYADEPRGSRVVNVDIAPNNLEAVLLELSSQADVQLIMSAEEVRGLASQGITGE